MFDQWLKKITESIKYFSAPFTELTANTFKIGFYVHTYSLKEEQSTDNLLSDIAFGFETVILFEFPI